MTDPVSPTQLNKIRQSAYNELSLDDAVTKEIRELELAGRKYVFKPETRCRVCRDSDNRQMINKLLAAGQTYASIIRTIQPINDQLDKKSKITYNSLWEHAKTHFPAERAAQAAYREILERRAAEHEKDFVMGVASAITPLAYLETVMTKGYGELTKELPNVDVELGMKAAEKLQALSVQGDQDQMVAKLMSRVNDIIDAVRNTVPEEMWEEIINKLEKKGPVYEKTPHQTPDEPKEEILEVEALDPDDPDLFDMSGDEDNVHIDPGPDSDE